MKYEVGVSVDTEQYYVLEADSLKEARAKAKAAWQRRIKQFMDFSIQRVADNTPLGGV